MAVHACPGAWNKALERGAAWQMSVEEGETRVVVGHRGLVCGDVGDELEGVHSQG